MNLSFKVFLSGLLLISANLASASATVALPFPKNGSALDTIDKEVRGVLRLDNQLILSIHNKSHFVVTPFFGVKKFQDQSFGKYTDSKRHPFSGGSNRGSWQGAVSVQNRLALFDGESLRVAVFDRKKFEFIGMKSIAWDLIRPAADRSGEATKTEVTKLRRRFKKSYLSTAALKVSGISADKGHWLGKRTKNFFLSSRVKGFPLITMKCFDSDMLSCQVDRACFLRNDSMKSSQISGVAVDLKKRELVFVDALKHKLVRYRFNSCFDSYKIGEITLPKKINEITGVHIDSQRNLWIVAIKPDSYHNASVYTWNDKTWSP